MPIGTDKIECIPDDQLDVVLEDIAFEGLKVISKFKADCGWTVVYTTQPGATPPADNEEGDTNNTPSPGPAPGPGPSPGPVPGPTNGLVRVVITPSDFDALCRVAQSEVGHFGKHGQSQLEGGLAAVVDTVINRVAHKGFPDAVQEVVDQPFQFSAINSLGSWTGLPAARQDVTKIIADHVQHRISGGPCSVKGATHFLNPHLSSQNALATWGNHVVANPVAIFGNNAKKDVHFHGFAPGTVLPRNYILEHGNQKAKFAGNGVTLGSSATGASLADKIVSICLEEWEFFEKGTRKEADDPQFLRIGDYWSGLGIAHNGRTQIVNQATGKSHNPPWSSAFISHVLKKAGAGSGFLYSQAHCHYVQDFISGRVNAVYEAMHPESYAPQRGDIVHFGRGGAKQHDFSAARGDYLADSFYPSHSDIVVSVDAGAKKITAIGGNVSNSVKDKKLKIDANGLLLPRPEGASTFPWIAVLRLVK
ncbi:DUF2272 domain-containing protein [Nitratireductor sp. XY-223]|uniref:DUF2272 domain-containing protein n=1 Tax=Nitratireductor sp. XY-223 TaxID=2561926 RepID=UPI0010AABB7A|nr:DUF2272 domain-containing protein [Nitratireductor sp. XY-223]